MTDLINPGDYACTLLDPVTRTAIDITLARLEKDIDETVPWDGLPLTMVCVHLSETATRDGGPDAATRAVGLTPLDLPDEWTGGAGFSAVLVEVGRSLLDHTKGLGPDSRALPHGPVVALAALSEGWTINAADHIAGVAIADNPAGRECRSAIVVLADGTTRTLLRVRGEDPVLGDPVHISWYPEDVGFERVLWLFGQGLGYFPPVAPPTAAGVITAP